MTKTLKNIGLIALITAIASTTALANSLIDLSSNATGNVTARGENNNINGAGYYELAVDAFDNDTTNKWLDFSANTWIQYQFTNAPYIVSEVVLYSANDFPERDPVTASVQGSNDGVNYTNLHTENNISFPGRHQAYNIAINNNTAYQYYRINLQAVNTQNILQLAEIDLLGDASQIFSSNLGEKPTYNGFTPPFSYNYKIQPFSKSYRLNCRWNSETRQLICD